MATPNFLSNTNATLLPPTITDPIFKQATEQSAVMSLARKVPLSVSAQTAIPVPMDIPVAGWVTEGGAKPVGAEGIGVKIMTGKKIALLVPVSQEVVMTNPGGLYDQLQQDLPASIARAFDYAAIHGIDLRTGAAGPFPDFLKMTANSIELGTSSQATGGMYADLVKGEQLVTNFNFDYTGIAADPRLRPLLKLQTDVQGRPLWVDTPQNGLRSGDISGVPAFYNRGVSGNYIRNGNKVQIATITGSPTGGTFTLSSVGNTTAGLAFNAAAATVQTALRGFGGLFAGVTVAGSAGGPYTITFPLAGAPITINGAGLTGGTPVVSVAQTVPAAPGSVRGVGGDWQQCAYGVGMDISIKVSAEASYVDEASVTHSAFQENLVLLLVEAYYGFVVGNPNAYVVFTDAS